MYSWPIVKFLLNGNSPSTIAGQPCFIISISVAQTAIASTRSSPSAGPGSGTGFSTSDNSSGPPRTHAFIVLGTRYSFRRCAAVSLLVATIVNLRGACCTIPEQKPHSRYSVLPVQPDIGQVLSNEMTGSYVPAS